MAKLREVVLVGYVRAPFCKADPKRGAFRNVRSDDLAVVVLHEILARTEVAAKDVDGNAYDLTNLTVTLTAERDGSEKIDGQAVNVTDAANGLFDYTPAAAEIDTEGEYVAQVKLVDGSQNVDYLEPFVISVRKPIAPSS